MFWLVLACGPLSRLFTHAATADRFISRTSTTQQLFGAAQDFSYTWLHEGDQSGFDIFTSQLGLSFDCAQLAFDEFVLSTLPEEQVVNSPASQLFQGSSKRNVFALEVSVDGSSERVRNKGAGNCQLVETGRLQQRRFIPLVPSISCPSGFNQEGSLCRSSDGSGNWLCSANCQKVAAAPWCVLTGTKTPCTGEGLTGSKGYVESGLELSVWPDQVALMYTAYPADGYAAAAGSVARATMRFGLDPALFAQLESRSGRTQALLHRSSGACLLVAPLAGQFEPFTGYSTVVGSVQGWADQSPLQVGLLLRAVQRTDCAAAAEVLETELAAGGQLALDIQLAYPSPACVTRTDNTAPYSLLTSVSCATGPLTPNFFGGVYKLDLNEGEKGEDFAMSLDLSLTNPSPLPQLLRFHLFSRDVNQVTGITALLRDGQSGDPLGLPVQISKNWHSKISSKWNGYWCSIYFQALIPAQTTASLSLVRASAFWGKSSRTNTELPAVSFEQLSLVMMMVVMVMMMMMNANAELPAVSFEQLSLVGYTSRGVQTQWDQAALGSFGETITFDPDIGLGRAMIDDVRPLYVASMNGQPNNFVWTENVGGGDFLVYQPQNTRMTLEQVRTEWKAMGPVLSDVTYSGNTLDGAIHASVKIQLMRADDYVRILFKLRYEVRRDISSWQRLALLQLGADNYNENIPKMLACGSGATLMSGMPRILPSYQSKGYFLQGIKGADWCALYGEEPLNKIGSWANRGLVVRRFEAQLSGETSQLPATFASYFTSQGAANLELQLPDSIRRLEAGDWLEMDVFELVVPQTVTDYLGPNSELRSALSGRSNDYSLLQREAVRNSLTVYTELGQTVTVYPIVVRANRNRAAFTVQGGMGYLTVSISGLSSYKDPRLQFFSASVIGSEIPQCAWERLDQTLYQQLGKDYWQTDYDSASETWTITFGVDTEGKVRRSNAGVTGSSGSSVKHFFRFALGSAFPDTSLCAATSWARGAPSPSYNNAATSSNDPYNNNAASSYNNNPASTSNNNNNNPASSYVGYSSFPSSPSYSSYSYYNRNPSSNQYSSSSSYFNTAAGIPYSSSFSSYNTDPYSSSYNTNPYSPSYSSSYYNPAPSSNFYSSSSSSYYSTNPSSNQYSSSSSRSNAASSNNPYSSPSSYYNSAPSSNFYSSSSSSNYNWNPSANSYYSSNYKNFGSASNPYYSSSSSFSSSANTASFYDPYAASSPSSFYNSAAPYTSYSSSSYNPSPSYTSPSSSSSYYNSASSSYNSYSSNSFPSFASYSNPSSYFPNTNGYSTGYNGRGRN
eukprot:g12745.t1